MRQDAESVNEDTSWLRMATVSDWWKDALRLTAVVGALSVDSTTRCWLWGQVNQQYVSEDWTTVRGIRHWDVNSAELASKL